MEAIHVSDAPNAIGPYCHAMRVGNLLFCSGQTPLDPASMKLVGTTIEEQTRFIRNMELERRAKEALAEKARKKKAPAKKKKAPAKKK